MSKRKSKRRRPKVEGSGTGAAKVPWTPFQVGQHGSAQAGEDSAGRRYVGTFINNLYQVMMYEIHTAFGWTTWLMIINRDRSARHDWRHFQRIKNELVGPEREAVELYPAESRLVDTNNQYHLFVFPEGICVPVGYMERDVADQQIPGSAHKQRPFAVKPEGLNGRALGDGRIGIFGMPPPEEDDDGEPEPGQATRG